MGKVTMPFYTKCSKCGASIYVHAGGAAYCGSCGTLYQFGDKE